MDFTNEIIHTIQERYKCIIEHPWKKYPDYITVKDPESKKWFAAFLQTRGKNLGIDTEEIISFVNVKADTDLIHMLTNQEGYFPGYHMNKDHWLTILLDGSVPLDQIYPLIDASYDLITNSPTKRIYEAVQKVPKGKVATYGQIAAMAGNPKMSRAVGNALHKNPDESGIPCYRIVNSQGRLSDAFVFGGVHIQEERLKADGIEVNNLHVDLSKYGIRLDEIEE